MSLSVVLAGGGSRDTSRRCSRSRTPAPARPGGRASRRSAPPRAWRRGSCPRPATRSPPFPRVPLPRRPSADLGRCPSGCAAAVAAAARGHGGVPGRGRRRLRRLRLDAGVPGGPAARAADRRARAERPARPGQPARRPVHAVRGRHLPGHAAARARVLGMPLRRQITTLDRARCATAGWPPSASSRPDHAARVRRLARRAAPQRRPSARPGRRCSPPASRCCTSRAAARPSRGSRATRLPGEPRYVAVEYSTGWTSPTPPPTWSSAGPARAPSAR